MNPTTSTTYSFSAVATSSETVAPGLLNLGCLYSLKRRELHITETELTKKCFKKKKRKEKKKALTYDKAKDDHIGLSLISYMSCRVNSSPATIGIAIML